MASNNTGIIYKYRFLSEPDESLKCLICLDVAEDPWQHVDCGRLFCKECLDKHGKSKPCPNCRKEQPQYFPDNRSKREIRSLCVKCHNVEHTCTWEGTVGTVEEHVATCQFTLLPCPKKCKDDSDKANHFMRKDLERHLKEDCPNREYKCEYCGEEGTFATITQVHDETCEKKIVPCTNTECPETLQRQHISHHVESECEHTVIACKYMSIGCETELRRKDLVAHELDDKFHLHMAIDIITEITKQLDDTFEVIEKEFVNKSDIVLEEGKSMNIGFTDYKERKEREEQFTFPSFYTSQGYHMAFRVYANGTGGGEGTHISVFSEIMEGKHDDHLRWPLVGSITVTLLNQLEDKNHFSKVIDLNNKDDTKVGKIWGYNKFIPHSALDHDPIKNTQYLKDDTLYFRVKVKVEDDKPWLRCTTCITEN